MNYSETGWDIITQRAHAILAAQIALYWADQCRPRRWLETLIAIGCHDDQLLEFEDVSQLQASGGPMNFKMNSFDEAYCDHLMSMGMARSRYVGLLMSRHLSFLYQNDPKAMDYLKELNARELLWLQQAEVTVDEVDQAYQLLQFCDAFSLLICRNLIPPENRKIEICKGLNNKSYELYENERGKLIINPWPFSVKEFMLNYEVRNIEELTYRDDADFHDSLAKAPVRLKSVICAQE